MRIFSAVSRYIQGPGVLDDIGAVSAEFGSRALLITDDDLKVRFGQRVAASFDSAAVDLSLMTFPGEVTHRAIDALADQARSFMPNVVLGLGGGKALDIAKGVALKIKRPFISVPTIAATDAPASLAIAVYDEHHVLTDILKLPRNPDVVLVDTAVICAAPLRFFLAGIGDAISKKFEAEACHAAKGDTPNGTLSNHTGLAIADACYRLIREHAELAVAAVKGGVLGGDEHIEALVEATVLLSTMSFENAGLSIAHAVAKAFPVVPRSSRTLHGEHVAYGLLVQLMLERRARDFIDDIFAFYRRVGLPTSLRDLQLDDITDDEKLLLIDTAMTSPSVKRFATTVTPALLEEAVDQVERFS